jgi:hypothetical protein
VIKNLVILTLCLIPSLLIFGYLNENGDINSGGMYLVVLFVPCLIAIIATLGLTKLTQKFLSWEKLSYLVPLLLLTIVIFYPKENWRPILTVTIITATIMNFGLTEVQKKNKKTRHNNG